MKAMALNENKLNEFKMPIYSPMLLLCYQNSIVLLPWANTFGNGALKEVIFIFFVQMQWEASYFFVKF